MKCMKNRMFRMGLALTAALFALTGTALAGGVDIYVRTYDELLAALETQETIYLLPNAGDGFGWPAEGATVTFDGDQDRLRATLYGDWEIPANVTVELKDTHALSANFRYDSATQAAPVITVRGKITDESGGMHNFSSCDLVVESGGTLEMNSLRVDENCKLTIQEGAVLDAYHDENYSSAYSRMNIRLDGEIHGENAEVTADINVWPGFNGKDSNAVLSGTLALPEYVRIRGGSDAAGHNGALTIAEGAHVTMRREDTYSPNLMLDKENTTAVLNVNGILEVYNQASSNGTIRIGPDGVLRIRPTASIEPFSSDGGETGETGAIDGTGRLELYGAYLLSAYDNRFYFRRPEVYLDISAVDWSKTTDPYALDPRPDFVGPEVQLWRSWREGVSSPLNPMGASWGTDKGSSTVTFLDPSRAEQLPSTALLAVLYDKTTGQLLRIVPGALQSGMVFRFDCELGQGWNLIAADNGGSFAPLCGKMELLDTRLVRETSSG